MQTRRFLVLAGALLALTGRAASAQDARKTGVTMGYPASIGIIWHASGKVAIRPELTLTGGSSSGTSSTSATFDGSNWAVGTGLGVLLYLHTDDHLKTYFSPRVTYARTSVTNSNNTGANSTTAKLTSANYGATGSFGAQYELSDKFSLFGEVGAGVNHTTGSSDGLLGKTTTNTWGTRSGVGVIFYF